MSQKNENRRKALRRKAEELLDKPSGELDDIPVSELKALVHELHVHQVELEIQNEEMRQVQEDLARARDRYASLFDNAPVGYLIIDDAGIIHQSNRTFAEMMGRSVFDLHQEPFSSFIVPEDRDVFLSRFNAFFKSPGGKRMEVRVEGRRGFFHTRLEGRMNPSLIPTGGDSRREKRLLLTVSDISDRKAAEAERERIEGQLHQAQKMEAVGRLAAGVAHDFNNMLSPILGYSEMLLEDLPPGDPRYEQASLIKSAAESSRDLVRQLLAFSRKQILELKPLNLSRLVDNLRKILRRVIREDIRVRYVLEPHPGIVRGDASRIEQILMNLAANARDAMPGGGVLSIETTPVVLEESPTARQAGIEPGPYVELTVSDDGCGMDDETIERIFEPFFTSKGKWEGTGLGLATVHGIVRQHGGGVSVRSEPGRGTTFKLYFPRISDASPEDRPLSPSAPSLSGKAGETVMVVEDDAMVRKLTVNILGRRGYKVLEASSGPRCLRVLREHDGPLHLLLTDVVMPDMNGKDLYFRLLEDYPSLKVLYMSGYTDDVIARHGVLEEEARFIAKPFSVRSLAEKVRQALES